MKQTIRLTERELKRLISESISKIMEDIYSNPMGRPEGRINPFPQYNSDFDDEEPMFPIPNKPRLHTLDRTTDSFSDWRKGDHAYYDDGEVYPSAEWSDTDMYGKPSHHSQWAIDADKDLEKMQNQRFKDELDKQWQDTKDKEKYSKMADSRPLHRKGSLNRAMEEAIRKTVNKILSEGKHINNRIPFPLSDMDYVDDNGDIKTLRKDKFADEYTNPKAEAKRKERSKRRRKMKRLFYDGILKDISLEANLRALKQGDDKWMDELSQWGAAQWLFFDPTEGKRVGATPLMELWEIDGVYNFIVRKGREKEVLGY